MTIYLGFYPRFGESVLLSVAKDRVYRLLFSEIGFQKNLFIYILYIVNKLIYFENTLNRQAVRQIKFNFQFLFHF